MFEAYHRKEELTEEQKKAERLIALWGENFKQDIEYTGKPPKDVLKIYNIGQAKYEVENLIKAHADFEVVETSTSVRIKEFTKKGIKERWYLENTKSDYFLILLNKLKRDILKRQEFVIRSRYSANINDIKYFSFNPNLNKFEEDRGNVYELKNCFEADAEKAYYRAAYVLGFIEKDTYEEIINNMTKRERLRLLGCVATVKTTEIYVKGILVDQKSTIKQDDVILYRKAWFKICHYVDTALLHLKSILNDDFLFYWVDGIYFKHDTLKDELKESNFWRSIRDVSVKFDLDFKIIALDRFEVLNKVSYVEVNCYKPNNPKPKRFFPKREQIRDYSIVSLNDLNNI
jgi:hypothetical protein